MIMAESQDLKIAIITGGGTTTRIEQDNPQEQPQPQVRPAAHKNESPTGQKHKEIFWDVQSEFISPDIPSASVKVKDMPERFQHLL